MFPSVQNYQNKCEEDVFYCAKIVPNDYKCDFCNFKCALKIDFHDHFVRVHNRAEIKNNIRDIMKKWNFEKCNFQTYSFLVLYEHRCKPWGLKMETNAEDSSNTPFDCANILQLYKCKICDFGTNLKLLLKSHVKQTHNDPTICDSSIAANSRKSFSCKKCNFQTCSVLVLYKHVCTLVRNTRNEKSTEWFQCEHCHFKCKWQSSLETHLKVIHSVGKWYYCEHSKSCKFKTLWKSSLKVHLRVVHSVTDQYHCKHCKCTFTRKMSLTKHLKVTHSIGEWYHCEHSKSCKFKTLWKSSLKQHLRVTHSVRDQYHCKHCKCTFAQKMYLKKHVLEKHPEIDKWLHCEHCGFKTTRIYSLELHVKRKHGTRTWFECEHCQSKFERILQLKRHIQLQHTTSKRKWYQCEYCEYINKVPKLMRNHLSRRHSNDHKTDTHQCDLCEYKTELKSSLVRHLEIVHSVKSNFKYFNCLYCQQIFMLKSQLTKHVADQHSIEDEIAKSFHCQYCDYKARRLNTLNSHIYWCHKDRTVHKAKWYKCNYCEYNTQESTQMRYHLLRQHSNNCKTFQCDRCQYTTELKSSLEKHLQFAHSIKLFKRFKCVRCEQIFILKSQLRKHVVDQHSNETDIAKTFHCQHCDYKAQCLSTLNTHIRLHKDPEKVSREIVKPFHCEHCDYKARSLATLNRHINRSHKEHKKVRGYTCDHCGNIFKLKVDFEYHLLELRAIKAGNLVPRDQCEDKVPYLSILREHDYSLTSRSSET